MSEFDLTCLATVEDGMDTDISLLTGIQRTGMLKCCEQDEEYISERLR